jgi:hypothetical protein
LKQAETSSDIAANAVKEAAHQRIDAQAPRVVALLDKPVIGGLESSGDFEWGDSQEFILPKNKDDHLWVMAVGRLVNEGSSIARVRLHGGAAKFIDSEGPDLVPGPIKPDNEERLLKPGEEIGFQWNASHTIADWADAFSNPSPPNLHGFCQMQIAVTDFQEDGIMDTIWLEMSGRPIEQVPEDNSHWRVTEAEFVARAYPIHRTYRKEGWASPTLPWAETFKEWSKIHRADVDES